MHLHRPRPQDRTWNFQMPLLHHLTDLRQLQHRKTAVLILHLEWILIQE